MTKYRQIYLNLFTSNIFATKNGTVKFLYKELDGA